MTVYLDNATYKRQKGALTRAVNSGDPLKVLAAVERTLDEWDGKAWPDGWATWSVALDDASWAFQRDGRYEGDTSEILARFEAARGRFW
jgi:hypothetical protein